MMQVALTGNIGSGKTTVSRVFELLGVPVFNADTVGRQITNTPGVLQQIQRVFGNQVFGEHHQLDRGKLAEIVFSDKEALTSLNKIIHPLVQRAYLQWIAMLSHNTYCIKETAVLFETGNGRYFNNIIVVSAPRETRIKRVCMRDGVSRHEVIQRINNQMDQELLIEKADFVIANDDYHAVIPQVLNLHSLFLAKAMSESPL